LEKLKVLTNLTETELFSVLKESQQIVVSIVVNQVNSKQKQSKLIPLSLKQKFLALQKQLFFFSLLDYQVYQILEKEKFIFDDQRLMNLHFLITEKYQREKIQQIDLQELLNLLKDNELLPFYQEIINQHQNKKSQFAASIIKDDIKNIKNYRIELKIANLRSQITNTSNTEKQIELLQQMSNLKKNLIK